MGAFCPGVAVPDVFGEEEVAFALVEDFALGVGGPGGEGLLVAWVEVGAGVDPGDEWGKVDGFAVDGADGVLELAAEGAVFFFCARGN